MPKRTVIVHSIWGLVSVGLLLSGSRLGRGASGNDEPKEVKIPVSRGGMAKSAGPEEEPPFIPLPDALLEEQSVVAGEWSSRKSAVTVTRSRKLHSARRSLSQASSEALRTRGPLSGAQINALVVQSIKGASPVERRKAFDRILKEMSSPTFTREQAFLMRSEMARNGADGRMWQLWDYAWGANDPATAVAHLAEIEPRYFEGFLGNMIPGLASVDARGAIDVFSELNPDVQSRVRRRLLEGLIDNDVAVATDYMYDSTDLQNYNWRPMDTLARELVRDQGLESALEWAHELPEGPLRGSAWSATYAHWGSRDPQRAIESIMEMDPSTDRNLAINGFTAAYAHENGSTAVEWAAEITNPSLREGALARAFTQYHRQDPSAAAEAFRSMDVAREVWQRATGQAWSEASGAGRGGTAGAAPTEGNQTAN